MGELDLVDVNQQARMPGDSNLAELARSPRPSGLTQGDGPGGETCGLAQGAGSAGWPRGRDCAWFVRLALLTAGLPLLSLKGKATTIRPHPAPGLRHGQHPRKLRRQSRRTGPH